ncbi:uncharacterized protein LOC131025964 isoform X3 [Salvia miltiorrhiza]|uniref:uncharacterized protein LOC131025964 isoform X3 n=1 Tax=Salvia miltiorrhiza TaxID=226208 RepID=UPI0025AD79B8|nr:uncharacterized protein LOC131025964 isoform X3 [Salvia miltiorrhiza]
MPSPVVSCTTSELRCSALSRIPASDAGSLQVRLRLLLCPFGSNIVVRTACCSVGVVLPVYSTFKAIETKDQDDQHKWLVCWAGSFLLSESIGNCSRTGGLSISLAGSDGRVLGGGVFGMLKAASPVQVSDCHSKLCDGKI